MERTTKEHLLFHSAESANGSVSSASSISDASVQCGSQDNPPTLDRDIDTASESESLDSSPSEEDSSADGMEFASHNLPLLGFRHYEYSTDGLNQPFVRSVESEGLARVHAPASAANQVVAENVLTPISPVSSSSKPYNDPKAFKTWIETKLADTAARSPYPAAIDGDNLRVAVAGRQQSPTVPATSARAYQWNVIPFPARAAGSEQQDYSFAMQSWLADRDGPYAPIATGHDRIQAVSLGWALPES